MRTGRQPLLQQNSFNLKLRSLVNTSTAIRYTKQLRQGQHNIIVVHVKLCDPDLELEIKLSGTTTARLTDHTATRLQTTS